MNPITETSAIQLVGVSKRYSGSTGPEESESVDRPIGKTTARQLKSGKQDVPTLDDLLTDRRTAVRKGNWAVKSLSLSIEQGELLVLLGPSGCGKSTTLRLIAGLEICDRGQVLMDRQPADPVPHRRDLALVFQEAALFPHLTVFGNIAFGLGSDQDSGVFNVLRRMFRPTRPNSNSARSRGFETRVRQTARMLGLEKLLGRRPHQLSGGERQRVALGRAIVRNPAAFLLDEPLSNIDQWQRVQLRKDLKRIQKETGTTTVYVTHELGEAFALADRIAVMNHGCLAQLGTPTELVNAPDSMFVAHFMGEGQVNWLKLTGAQFQLQPESAAAQLAAEQQTTTDSSGALGGWLVSHRPGWRIPICLKAWPSVSLAMEQDGCWMGVWPHGLIPVETRTATNRPTTGKRRDDNEDDNELAKNQSLSQLSATVAAVQTAGWYWEMELKVSPALPNDSAPVESSPTDQLTWTARVPATPSVAESPVTQGSTASGSLTPGSLSHRSSMPAVGDTIGLKFAPERLHFFDLHTGQNLRKDINETK